GWRSWMSLRIVLMPWATSGAESPLLVPIMTTATLGEKPSSSPLRRRQITCSVRSPLMPKLAALSGAKNLSQIALPPLRQPSVIESPTNRRSMPPAFATFRNSSWRFRSFSTGIVVLGPFPCAAATIMTRARRRKIMPASPDQPVLDLIPEGLSHDTEFLRDSVLPRGRQELG